MHIELRLRNFSKATNSINWPISFFLSKKIIKFALHYRCVIPRKWRVRKSTAFTYCLLWFMHVNLVYREQLSSFASTIFVSHSISLQCRRYILVSILFFFVGIFSYSQYIHTVQIHFTHETTSTPVMRILSTLSVNNISNSSLTF